MNAAAAEKRYTAQECDARDDAMKYYSRVHKKII